MGVDISKYGILVPSPLWVMQPCQWRGHCWGQGNEILNQEISKVV